MKYRGLRNILFSGTFTVLASVAYTQHQENIELKEQLQEQQEILLNLLHNPQNIAPRYQLTPYIQKEKRETIEDLI